MSERTPEQTDHQLAHISPGGLISKDGMAQLPVPMPDGRSAKLEFQIRAKEPRTNRFEDPVLDDLVEAGTQAGNMIACGFARLTQAYSAALMAQKDRGMLNSDMREGETDSDVVEQFIFRNTFPELLRQLEATLGKANVDEMSDGLHQAFSLIVRNTSDTLIRNVDAGLEEETKTTGGYKERARCIAEARARFIEMFEGAEEMDIPEWKTWDDIPTEIRPAFFDLNEATEDELDISQPPAIGVIHYLLEGWGSDADSVKLSHFNDGVLLISLDKDGENEMVRDMVNLF